MNVGAGDEGTDRWLNGCLGSWKNGCGWMGG